MFTGAMHIDGSLAIRSTGPDDRGQAFSGSWANLGLTLDDCVALLDDAERPSVLVHPLSAGRARPRRYPVRRRCNSQRMPTGRKPISA